MIDSLPPLMMRMFMYVRRNATNFDPQRPRHRHTMISNVAFGVASLTLEGAPSVAVFGGQPPVDGAVCVTSSPPLPVAT